MAYDDVWKFEVFRVGMGNEPLRVLEEGHMLQGTCTRDEAKEMLQERLKREPYPAPRGPVHPEAVRFLDGSGAEVLRYTTFDLHRDTRQQQGARMPVTADDVKVGRCFVTEPGKQVRRVTKITPDGGVNYDARGQHHSGKDDWHPGPTLAKLPTKEEFAGQVDRRVTCDWDSRHQEREPSDEADRKYGER